MKHAAFLILTIVLCFGSGDRLLAQCCAAGNPVGGDGSQDALMKHQLFVFAAYRHSYSKDYFHLSKKEDTHHIEKSYYNYSSLSLSYGITWRMTLHSEIGYFFDKVQVINLSDGQQSIKAKGIGDLSLSLRYSLFPRKVVMENRLIASVGSRIPVGVFDQEQDGIKIPVSLQPSSGALKLNGSIFFSHKKKDALLGWSGFVFYEWSKIIEKDLLVYKYGNLFMFEGTMFHAIHSKIMVLLSGRAEVRGRDKRENDIEIESTGSRVVFVKPQIQLTVVDGLSIMAFADIPVYKYVNGYQLTNLFAFQIGLRKTFSL